MDTVLIGGAALALAAAALIVMSNGGKKAAGGRKGSVAEMSPPPFVSRELMSAAERSFFGVLCQLAGESHHVFVKVRLWDLIDVARGTERRQAWINKIDRKHVDFVLCSRDEVTPVMVVELDDKSHQRADRRKRDAEVDSYLAAAGIRVVRMPAQRAYEVKDIRSRIWDE